MAVIGGTWQDAKLGDVLTLQRGFDLPARERLDGPYPVVSSAGVTGHHAFAKAAPPGVVIGRYGSLGSVYWITEPYWPLNTALWVKDFKGNDPRYLSYLLRTIVMDGSSASAVPGVNRNHLHLLPVRVPSVKYQRRISAVLAIFDELIEINKRRIAVLEDLARSLYREWFLFYRFPDHQGAPTPEKLSGYIPPGWREIPFSSLAEIVKDGILPSQVDSDSRYCGLEHLPRRATTLQEWSTTESVTSRKYKFELGDTLFGKIRPYFHKVVWAPFDGLASSDAIVFRSHSDLHIPALVNAILSSDPLVAEAVATSNGTKMPRADASAILSYQVALPDIDGQLVHRAESSLRSTYDLAAALVRQNIAVSRARDLLLPRIVSGRLDIADIELKDVLPSEDDE